MLSDNKLKRNSVTFKLIAILLLISIFLTICIINHFNNLEINSSGTVLMSPTDKNSQGGNLKKTSRRYYDNPIFLNKCWEVFPCALDNNLLKFINNHSDSSCKEHISKYFYNVSIPYVNTYESNKKNVNNGQDNTPKIHNGNTDITGNSLNVNDTDNNPDTFFIKSTDKTIVNETLTYSLFINIGQDINLSSNSEEMETPYLIIPFQENEINKVIINNTKRDTNATHYGLYAGYTAYPITESQNSHITINIEVSPDINSKYIGLNNAPFIVNSKCLQKMNLLSTTTLFIPILLIFLSFIVGLLIIQTFNKKTNFFIFIALTLIFIFYSMIDGHYIIIEDLFLSNLIKNLLIMLSLNACNFLLFSFFKTKQRYKNIIPSLEAFIGFFIILPYTLFSANNGHITIFYNWDVLNLYIILVSFIALIRILISVRNNHYDFLAYIVSLSSFFIFLFVKHDNSKLIYYTPTYILFFIVMVLIIISYFAYKYVSEFNRAHLSNDYLQHEIELQTANLTQMNNSLVTINKRLTDNEKARKNIMSNLSHDLKTPITAIKGYSQLIKQSNNNPDETSVLSQNIIRRCDQMESLITDIIELSKLDAGENSLKKIPLSLSQILDEIYFLHEDEISRKNKILNIDIPKNDSLNIIGDPLKLSRVFENLLSNSIHYTNDDGIINIKAWRDNDIFVQLSDNGIGIPKEAIPHIFERFYRAKNSGKYIKGTGLGLSIVKLILDNHDAEISVTSEPEQGTTFTIKFHPMESEQPATYRSGDF